MTDCLSCRHAFPAIDQSGCVDFTKKVCKARPPTPFIVPGPGGQPALTAMFPLVGKGVWCAEHSDPAQPKPNLEAEARALLAKVGCEGWDDAEVMIMAAALRKAAAV